MTNSKVYVKIDVATETAKTSFSFEIEICGLMKMIFASF